MVLRSDASHGNVGQITTLGRSLASSFIVSSSKSMDSITWLVHTGTDPNMGAGTGGYTNRGGACP